MLVEQHVVCHAAAVLFTCAEEMRLASETFRPYRPKRQINVGYGITKPPEYNSRMADVFAQKCPDLKGRPYFLFLGRIHPKKGVDLLIKAYSALCRLNNNPQLPKLVIAGPGLETDYGQAMQKLAVEICPPQSVFWPGMLAGDAKWGALYNCEVFVLPSHQENFGIAVVETLSCGRPVLISDQVNIWREIKDSGAALVQANSVAGTTRLLFDWMSLPAEAKLNMTAKAKPCFQDYFSNESACRKLLAAIG
jgi:glycosyltransferase involved in cell wall biosynthesis